MREILFRGKDIVGNWYAGNLAVIKQDLHNGAGTIKAGSYISNKCGVPFAYQVRPETIGQFTGLTDKNGKKIFEGDIVKVCSGWNENATIVYDDAVARFLAKFKKWGAKSISQETVFEVIGNIHDNPELLP